MIRTLLLASLFTTTACIETDDTDTDDTNTEAAPGVPYVINNHERTYEHSGNHSTWWRSPTAYCSPGNVLFGQGYDQPYDPRILFRGLIPIQGAGQYPTAAQAAAQEDLHGTPENWLMTSYAICGRAMPSQQLVNYTSAYNSSASRNATVSCPGTLRVIGAGGTIHYGDGRVKVDEIRPNESLTQVTVYASEDSDGTTGSWEVEAYAICASPPAGLVRVTASAYRGWDGTLVTATCPGEKKLLGAGGGIDTATRTLFRLLRIMPSADLKSVTVRATSKFTGTFPLDPGEVKAYAICADG